MTAGAPPSACMCVWRGARNQHARGTRHAARGTQGTRGGQDVAPRLRDTHPTQRMTPRIIWFVA